MKANSIRARVRAEMTDEIKETARRHLQTEGANLSLRAVARDLGMVSSAIYRYFPSRDDLLTALILDAYNALGETAEHAVSLVPPQAPADRWLALARAVRDWAVAHPHEYALIYGSPVPGYHAPEDTVAAGIRAVTVLGRILQDAAESDTLDRIDDPLPPPDSVENLKRVCAVIAPSVRLETVARALSAWVTLFGQVSFEIFGQMRNTINHPAEFFDHQMRAQARYIGLR
ncbi:TetR/AcrR family transcriptional regulator [Dactylosporangium matsuzakiense]|uniref:TetR family transcriptional regulator n=1 Tax=Dactylosporangium matsuzakiense TaxID=53360 RepID=A0A9W6KGS6_9ACTN|nr:TetR/AcrR family transcriptional regulator [Dactylosporangium matsuzakiense]UWZ45781.1 TetR/AcrR family transcriptional regulator [Dactylosporangium matsuzakiense]GLK99975.1 TetR family transcriptional regulator [Dactylosporangium matsuzakiense]